LGAIENEYFLPNVENSEH